jgi:uncharacterized membrane protein YfcA
LLIVALIVTLKAWHGWRLGAVRQGIGLAALVAAAVAGVGGAPLVEPLLPPLTSVAEAARVPLAGMATGLAVYAAITLCAAVLFKKTEHQTIGVIRVGYGFIGALLGAIFGLVIGAALLTTYLAASGRAGLLEHVRGGELERALESLAPPPTSQPERAR